MEQPDFTPKIEILLPDQWREYQEIRLKALKTDPSAFGASYEQVAQHSEGEIRSMLSSPNRKFYATRVGDKIVTIADYSLETSANVSHLAKIHGVFTDPDFRGQGMAYKLLKKIMDDLHSNPKTARVTISVNNGNEAPKELYKKLGFVQFGIGHKEVKVAPKHYADQAQMELIFEDKL